MLSSIYNDSAIAIKISAVSISAANAGVTIDRLYRLPCLMFGNWRIKALLQVAIGR